MNHAQRGDKGSRAKLLSRPDLQGDALFHWEAFDRLSPERPMYSGMVPCPRRLTRDQIEKEADRLSLVGDGRSLFIGILVEADKFWVETEMKKLRDDLARRSAQQKG